MRFDTPIYFQRVQAGELDENTHNYGEDTIVETKVYASVSTTATETLKIVYGDIKQNSLTIRLQMPYKTAFDRIKVGEKFYKVDSAKQLRNKQVFVVSEVQGSFTGNPASGATYQDGYKDGFTDGEKQGYNNGVAVGEQQGYDKGFASGESQGYNNGYTKGETDGRQAEYDEFWDNFQQNGTRANYAFAFYYWNYKNYNPKYDIKPATHCGSMFQNSSIRDTKVTVDVSTCTSFATVFAYASRLTTIQKLIVSEQIKYDNWFVGCNVLANIVIEGVIANSISFSASPLTAESAISVINALKDYSGTSSEYAHTITFSSTTKEALEALGATAPDGLTWLEYAQAKGWNA